MITNIGAQAVQSRTLPRRFHRPVAVFDAGIGSYAAVAAIRRILPRQDILYLADRANFPYGTKTRYELLEILRRTLLFLDGFSPSAVLVASNVPSITLLEDLSDVISSPVFGVRPPIRAALATGPGDVAVLGVRAMVHSPELRAYADREAQHRRHQVHLIDASSLVDLVESGAFLFSADETQDEVDAFMRDLDRRHPAVGAFTLSSTHLPWLRGFIAKSSSVRPLLDPLDDAIAAIVPFASDGHGACAAMVTEDGRYCVRDFRRMLDRLGVDLPLQAVRI